MGLLKDIFSWFPASSAATIPQKPPYNKRRVRFVLDYTLLGGCSYYTTEEYINGTWRHVSGSTARTEKEGLEKYNRYKETGETTKTILRED
jgi:hypothetical protein